MYAIALFYVMTCKCFAPSASVPPALIVGGMAASGKGKTCATLDLLTRYMLKYR